MASPSQTQGSAPATQPLTPPAESSSAANGVTAPAASQTPAMPSTAPTTSTSQPPPIPGTSLQDSGKSRRPRDVRLVHMLLASLGVTAYQDRVPLQLLDFAYRYTSNILQDAVHLATEGYASAVEGTTGGKGSSSAEVNSVSLPALRLSIASRLHYQFQTGLPKEFLMDVASERNRIALPGVSRGFDAAAAPNGAAPGSANQSVMMAGMRLPPERFCLTGTGWNLKDEWDSEGEEEEDLPDAAQQQAMEGAGAEEDNEGDEDEDGKMEDIFGEDTAMGGTGEGDEDQKMNDA
ncbi:Histidine biosynthesis trifunctional-protein [Penicillium atrosanguineum]|uniref:Histidine biosynthesis trifunctional-protein n=1 Tax=Penicillium atrosanguineum TaxID=1132637 RepID=UPI00238562DD|nr:Histidine biosynthesis trifunctional-protein [Penicillium atrosanguineum]KAJ5147011.1 Histone-fold [Penicillium atrosanguineum]KAJ5314508.1 Histidine biosynthesis trifunctional-protein [Penicillium atrosanguineum]